MVEERRWKELIREVPIQKGDFFQINPGCLHAIKGGTLILETQQSSDVTYRFYDYDRLSDGKPRPLHIAQSLAVTQVPHSLEAPKQETCRQGGAEITHLVTCPYYAVYRAPAGWTAGRPTGSSLCECKHHRRLRHPGRPAGEQGGPSPDSRRLRTDGSGGEPGAYLLSFVIGTKINTGKTAEATGFCGFFAPGRPQDDDKYFKSVRKEKTGSKHGHILPNTSGEGGIWYLCTRPV